jgi:hypothetical protein
MIIRRFEDVKEVTLHRVDFITMSNPQSHHIFNLSSPFRYNWLLIVAFDLFLNYMFICLFLLKRNSKIQLRLLFIYFLFQ